MNERLRFLKHKAYKLRYYSLLMTTRAGSGHPTSCLSGADLVAGLFFYAMQYNQKCYHQENNDRFILSKGHASPLLYAAWKEAGVLSEQDLMTYRAIDSVLEGHPTLRFAYTEAATGSLGIGLSIGAGMALAAKRFGRTYRTYVLLGDSESTEGAIWEAVEIAAFYKLDNLVAIVDVNRLGQSTQTVEGHEVEQYEKKFQAFGWETINIDGHNMADIVHAYDQAKKVQGRPTVVIAKTYKGYGVYDIQDKQGYHGKPVSEDELDGALKKLSSYFAEDIQPNESLPEWKPQLPSEPAPDEPRGCSEKISLHAPYIKGEREATRKAYGKAISALGHICPEVVSLDAEVKNSTHAEFFEKDFPERFVQCFIAEQNMVGMGVGFQRRGYVPFISTFGAFFTRAADQIRMAAIGNAALRLVGSHAGVSIGQDGPSQMALEDISLMSALPGSIVLYPSDAVSTYALVAQMAHYDTGISYLRTTRMATPILYTPDQRFRIGGCAVLHESTRDQVCIIAAGVTLFQALKAHEQLKAEGISSAVIDLYSVKPLDIETLRFVCKKAGGKVITVEDHYLQGGIGAQVSYALRNDGMNIRCLAVRDLPRSGSPEDLLAWAGIDAQAIVQEAHSIII